MSNKIILITKSNNLLLQILPVCSNKKDKVLLNFNTRKILCDHVEFGTINFNHPIHIDETILLKKYSTISLKQNLFLFVIQH